MIRSNNPRRPGTISTVSSKKSNYYDQNTPEVYSGYSKFPSKQINDRIYKEHSVTELDLRGRNISNIQTQIPEIKWSQLVSLNLSHNRIQVFPPTIFNSLLSLQKLMLSNNQLSKLSIPYLKTSPIQVLHVANNSLTNINLEHLPSLIKLDCSNNSISFLTLPASLQVLDCSHNQITNLYFLEKCQLIQELNLGHNMLYDLKFTFRPHRNQNQGFTRLRFLNCSDNKIQFIEGFQYINNLTVLTLSGNHLSLTRPMINQLIKLQNLQELDIINNPLEQGGFVLNQINKILFQRMQTLKILNGEHFSLVDNCQQQNNGRIADQPYQLFMQSHRKPQQSKPSIAEHIFTLGDYEAQNQEQNNRINQFSDIIGQPIDRRGQEYNRGSIQAQNLPKNGNQLERTIKIQNEMAKTDFTKMTVLKPNKIGLATPYLPYRQILKQLLQMSYVPCHVIPRSTPKITFKRLDYQDDEYNLIQKMFAQKGGVVYVKKVNKWMINQQGQQIFHKHCAPLKQAQMGFLMNQCNEEEFRQLCKFNRLLPRKNKDIVSQQPDAFACYHIIVRHVPFCPLNQYPCVYYVQSATL